jgi:adenylate cyclase
MAEIITGKVIIIVLVMLFAMPFLEVDIVDDFPSYGLDVIEMAQDQTCVDLTVAVTGPTCVAECTFGDVPCTKVRCREDRGCTYEPTAMELVNEYVDNAGKGRVLRITIGNGALAYDAYITATFAERTESLRTGFMSGYASETGAVSAVWDDSEVVEDDAVYSIWRTIFVIVLLGLGSVLFGRDAARLSSRITGPLALLAKDMNKVSELQLDEVGLTESPIFEVNIMLDSFTKMKTGLTSFIKFVPRMVVRNLLRAGKTGVTGVEGVERKQLTIFFSNIANFEEVSQKLETLEMMEMLSDYFSEMSNIFEETDGTLIEFVGDEILALWNAPLDVPSHQATCCDAALRMQARVKECFDTRWQEKGWPWIDVKIGVNTASVFVGNLGAPDRMKYGVLGDGVNMAARLQMLNRRYKTKILGTQTIIDDLKVQETFRTRCVDVVAVKGKTIGVSVYEILSRRDDDSNAEVHDKICESYGAGFECYKSRKFEEAATHLQGLLTWLSEQQLPADLATEILLERTKRFALNPPAEPWDGVDKVKSKTG